jgi:hypothetical protein
MGHMSEKKLISLRKFLDEVGVTATTAWRWRRRGLLEVTNIYGRLYLTDEAIAAFQSRAVAGEFARIHKTPPREGRAKP